MPYLTPEETPEERDCRALLIPASTEWLAIFSGALTELSKRWNWQQQGISVDSALAVVNEVLEGFYDGCVSSGCQQPDGWAVLRINSVGEVEQLINGEWVPPTGEYEIPPVPARTEPTPDERKCLAAANTANVLETAYEILSDAFEEHITASEAYTRLIAGIALAAFPFAPIVSGLVLILAGLAEVLYEQMEYVSADVWDSEFTDVLRCLLYECSTDADGVVTYNYDCLMQKLLEQNLTPPWSEARARLATQLSYLIPVSGGVGMLNAAGTTTEISTADCDDCNDAWCYVWYAENNDGGFVPEAAGVGDYVSGQWWTSEDIPAWFGIDRNLLYGQFNFSSPIEVETIDIHYNWLVGTSSNVTEGFGVYTEDFTQNLVSYDQDLMHDGTDEAEHLAPMVPYLLNDLGIWMQPAYNAFGGFAQLTIIQMTGHGSKPTFLEAMGWEECPV